MNAATQFLGRLGEGREDGGDGGRVSCIRRKSYRDARRGPTRVIAHDHSNGGEAARDLPVFNGVAVALCVSEQEFELTVRLRAAAVALGQRGLVGVKGTKLCRRQSRQERPTARGQMSREAHANVGHAPGRPFAGQARGPPW
jgi:hypothetical protein